MTAALSPAAVAAAIIAPQVLAQVRATGTADSLILLAGKPPLALLRNDSVLAHRRALVDALRSQAHTDQASVRAWLDAQQVDYQSFWIVNMIRARLDAAQIDALRSRDDVARIDANPLIRRSMPEPSVTLSASPQAVNSIEWNLEQIHAPAVWALGFTGQGVVIAGEDTGYQWDHPALKAAYRGWNGSVANHNYHWHDAIHVANNSCNANTQAPCDDKGHGTHTMGIMLGDDGGANRIGVAPGARWIGCRNMDAGDGTPARYIECMQWMLAPTDLAGNLPRPDLAPDIINNSWGCVPIEGCTSGEEIHQAVDAVVDGGIFFVVAAGNRGPGCASVTDAPATYAKSFVVGASTSSGTIANSSSRGPVTGLGVNKPDVVAPGLGVRSSYPVDSYKPLSGTSMAAPHVAGTAALMMSINPALRGHPQQVADILRATAVPLSAVTKSGGGVPPTTYPNPVQGYGQIDAYAAVIMADTLFTDGFE
ncbi:MAG: S8 family serine peptidase [Xanthomonadales bacterium]|nr:S8 family serine peptidase [Xanthomonadales bacterium]